MIRVLTSTPTHEHEVILTLNIKMVLVFIELGTRWIRVLTPAIPF